MNKVISLLVCWSLLLGLASAHSWIQCADYTEENGRNWSPANCRGWPRGYSSIFQQAGYVFGADVGYDDNSATETAPCKPALASGQYTAAYPKASYTPGQRICLAWPPKNHVAANCNNPNIGDGGTKIYRSGVNPTADPTLSQFKTNLVYDFGANTGTSGTAFQNCPNFCANAGAALCTGCFEVPSNLALGDYTFLWEWGFSGSTYSNCFDVSIVANTGNYIKATYTHMSPDNYAALVQSGGADTPVINSGVTYDTNTEGSGGSGMSSGGAAVLALFIIALVALIVGSVVGMKLGYITIDSKFPFWHKKDRDTSAHYVAFKD